MEQSNQSKKVLLSVIGVAILVVAVVGVSFAFFNYTRTGNTNTVETGTINFSSGYGEEVGDDVIEVTNFFPTAANQANSTNSDSMVITINGGTTYPAGLDYRLVVTGFTGTQVAGIPVQVTVTSDGLGGTTEAGNANSFVPLPASSGAAANVAEGLILGRGHIAASASNAAYSVTEGSVTITALIPNTVAISDTYDGEPGSTTTAWVNNRTVISTSDWNSLADNPITFKVRVESKQTGGNYAYTPYS